MKIRLNRYTHRKSWSQHKTNKYLQMKYKKVKVQLHSVKSTKKYAIYKKWLDDKGVVAPVSLIPLPHPVITTEMNKSWWGLEYLHFTIHNLKVFRVQLEDFERAMTWKVLNSGRVGMDWPFESQQSKVEFALNCILSSCAKGSLFFHWQTSRTSLTQWIRWS